MHRFAIICGLLLVALVPACASDGGKEMAVFTPAPPAGKADIAEGVVDRGALGFDAPADGTFDEDAELHGWHVAARGGAIVGVEITREGTSRDLDTTLWVYGPKDALGYGAEAIAFDDDSGWGRHSRIEDLQLPADGDYLIVVGTYDGQGRGRYRLALRCASSDCAPAAPEACVFGEDWAELPRSPGISIVGERSLDDAAGVEALEPVAAEQVLAAVSAGTFQEPASLADALELVNRKSIV